MPWVVKKTESGTWAVYKEGADGQPVGDALGTHDSEDGAKRQQRALYASEAKAVKFVDEEAGELEGLLLPYGGFLNGRDLDGQYFSAKTDFCLDWFPGDRPFLWHHGLDEDAGVSAIGRIKSIEMREDGGWMRAQLDKQGKYFAAIRELVKQGKVYLSSGAMAHLVQLDSKSGEILRWPLVEGSCTPTPSNLLATVKLADAAKHYKAAGLDLPDEDALKAKLDAAAIEELDAADFAYIDSEGGRHLPMHDAAHARNALARFNQTKFESDAAKQKARRKLIARAKEMGIEVGEEMMGGKVADLFALFLDDDPEINTALAGLPITTHAEVTAKYAASLAERTKDLRERRIKEGRVLSGMNRKRIRECMDAMDGAMTALRDLYDSTEPQPAKAASVRRVWAQMEALRMKALTLS